MPFAATVADLSGTWRAHEHVGDLARRFTDPSFADDHWSEVRVPGHWREVAALATANGPVLYRRTFAPPPVAVGVRRFLTFDGIFYYGDVWLDGGYLGATEGYFFPHTFEMTGAARAGDAPHTIAVEVACPPPGGRTDQRAILGGFAQSDTIDPRWNPGGLWRPVRVRDTGPVRIKWLRVLCEAATERHGRLRLDVTLNPGDEPDPVPLAARLDAEVTAPDGAVLATATRDVMLAGGDNRLTWTVDVDEPPRWWPWRLGEQPRCDIGVTVSVAGAPSDARRLRTAFREVRWHDWRLAVNGEPIFAMGSNQDPSRMALGTATRAELARDVQLAIDANLDLLRLRAHVSRPELYDAADEAGLLLWQDFPLRWGYARGTRKQAVRQAREMVDLLGHRPSVVLWCAHDEPFAVRAPGPGRAPVRRALRTGAAMLLPSWNKDVLDRSVFRALRKADATRAVDPHSGLPPGFLTGGTDAHLFVGWRRGRMDGLGRLLRAVPRLGRFVSAFGAPAVPDAAAFMEPVRWPNLEWDRLREEHAFDAATFERVVPPALFESFAAWREATQHHQAALVQLQIEDLRRIARSPAGGFCHLAFADTRPAVSFSVLDHERRPKLAHTALSDACRSVLPMLEPRRGAIHVSNESRAPLAGAVLEAHLDGAVRHFTGDVGARTVEYVGAVHLDRRTTSVTLVLRHPAIGEVRNTYDDVLEWLRIVQD